MPTDNFSARWPRPKPTVRWEEEFLRMLRERWAPLEPMRVGWRSSVTSRRRRVARGLALPKGARD